MKKQHPAMNHHDGAEMTGLFEAAMLVSIYQNFPNETQAVFADGLLEFDFGRKDDFQLALKISLETEKLSCIARQSRNLPDGVHSLHLFKLLRSQCLPQIVFMQQPT